jgi:hypothetical protein
MRGLAAPSIPGQRLRNQFLTRPLRQQPADLVARLGAVQAQEYPFAKWALALRLGPKTTDAEVERAFEAGDILRTHVMRPTWHFVAAPDIGWMQELTAPRVHTTLASYLRRQDLDRRLLLRASGIIERALGGGRFLTRAELRARLARAGITLTALQLSLVSLYAELERVICSGPRRGRLFTYALLAERARGLRQLSRDEALAELTARYFRSHGPATVRDFVWWSGLKTVDARRGLDMINARSFSVAGLTYWYTHRAVPARSKGVHLLPIYDEYLIAYRDRVAVPHRPGKVSRGSTMVTFTNALAIDGQIAGSWTLVDGSPPSVKVVPLRKLTSGEASGLEAATARFTRFRDPEHE